VHARPAQRDTLPAVPDSPSGPPPCDPPARRPRRSRLPLLLLPPVAAIGVLTSCEEPTPLVTVQSGSRVVKANATTYVRDGEVKQYTQDVPVLPVHLGDRVNIDVERNLAAQGWFVAFESLGRVTPVLKAHAASVLVPGFTQQGTLMMRIFAAPATASGDARGSWVFQLRQQY
jgi:hypothetical protein